MPVRTAADAAALLAALIGVDTHNPGGDEPALARRLGDELHARSPDALDVVVVPRADGAGNAAYVWARWGEPRLLVNAHLDTVPPSSGWSGDPFVARIDDDRGRGRGRVIGLGASDTKGSIAAALWALDMGRPRDVGVLFSGDEERGGACVRAFLDGPHARSIDRAIVCEPTGCRVGTRHRGILGLLIRMAGTGGHSSRADDLPAPVADLARLAAALADWGKRHRPLGPPGFPGMCMNVARLDGGVAFNVVPESATLTFSVRPPPGADVEAVRADLVALSATVAPSAVATLLLSNPPFETRDAEKFRPLLGGAVDAPIALGYWTEAALFAEAGIDAVVFGPGDVAQAHAPDEFVPIAEIETAAQTLRKAIDGPR